MVHQSERVGAIDCLTLCYNSMSLYQRLVEKVEESLKTIDYAVGLAKSSV